MIVCLHESLALLVVGRDLALLVHDRIDEQASLAVGEGIVVGELAEREVCACFFITQRFLPRPRRMWVRHSDVLRFYGGGEDATAVNHMCMCMYMDAKTCGAEKEPSGEIVELWLKVAFSPTGGARHAERGKTAHGHDGAFQGYF